MRQLQNPVASAPSPTQSDVSSQFCVRRRGRRRDNLKALQLPLMKKLLFSAAVLAVASAEAFTLASKSACARLVVAAGEPEGVWLAANDLRSDVRKITGLELALVRGAAPVAGDVYIATAKRPVWEAYTVSDADGILRIAGSDDRGTMFGVYDFIERYLGVDPMWFWSGVPHPKKAALAWDAVAIDQPSPSFRFRGWFLNDEDFINSWKPYAGHRDVRRGITFVDEIMGHETLEHVLEALVRCRMNMIIPSSYFDPGNPADAHCLDQIAARGVFVTQHHHDPLGLSGFMFDNTYRSLGKKAVYSYHANPEELKAEWRRAAGIYARHPNVVWQIGMRGHSDSPTWKSDPTMPQTDEGRAKVISDAMHEQVKILKELGISDDNLHMTATLWAEGSYFNRLGLLDIPAGSTVIFSDNSPGWVWPSDFYDVKRRSDLKYGVYYHHQLISSGPHVCSMIPATRTYGMLKEAYDTKANEYVVFNVGNIREFCYGIDASAKITWNIGAFDPAAWQRGWIARGVGGARAEDWSRVLDMYYDSFALHPESKTPCYLDGHFVYHGMGGFGKRKNREDIAGPLRKKIAALKAGKGEVLVPDNGVAFDPAVYDKDPMQAALIPLMHPRMISRADRCRRLASQAAGFGFALRYAEALLAEVPADGRDFAIDQLVFPIKVMKRMTDAYIAVNEANAAADVKDLAGCRAALVRAKAGMESLLALEGERNRGKWAGWWNQAVHQRIDFKRDLKRLDKLLGEDAK